MTTTPNKVERELHSLEPSAIIELFQLHLTAAVNGIDTVYYFHAGTNQVSENIVFTDAFVEPNEAKTYSAVPIEVDGFEVTTKGTLPRPSMKIANADGAITALLNAYNPLRAEVRRIRTCKKFLDGEPAADPTAVFNGGYESWYIDRVATENPQVVEFELVGKLDLTNLRLPARQVVEHCPWVYKGAECGYKLPGNENKGRFDLNNNETNTAGDQCAKNLRACELRHPKGLLPFGGFPGARLQV